MYYKRQRKNFIIAGLTLLAVMILICVCSAKSEKPKEREKETESEEKESFLATIYKSKEGTILYDKSMEEFEDPEKIVLSVREGMEVRLTVETGVGAQYTGMDVIRGNGMELLVSEAARTQGICCSFTMPQDNVVIHVFYEEAETEEPEETETEARYDIQIAGLSSAILKSYRGHFNKKQFTDALGDYFDVGNIKSDYHSVYKATFLEDPYPDNEEGTVSHYFCFNEDTDWKILGTFHRKDGTYTFRDIKREEEQKRKQEEKEKQEQEERARQQSEAQALQERARQESESQKTETELQKASESQSASAIPEEAGQVQEHTEEVTVELEDVSTELMDYIGDDSIFDAVTTYVFNSGRRGRLTGKMKEHQLHPKEKRATFKIRLSGGGTIDGEYNKRSKSFSFSGL